MGACEPLASRAAKPGHRCGGDNRTIPLFEAICQRLFELFCVHQASRVHAGRVRLPVNKKIGKSSGAAARSARAPSVLLGDARRALFVSALRLRYLQYVAGV